MTPEVTQSLARNARMPLCLVSAIKLGFSFSAEVGNFLPVLPPDLCGKIIPSSNFLLTALRFQLSLCGMATASSRR